MRKERKEKNNSDTKTLVAAIIQGMQDKKAADIALLDLRSVNNAAADYFILCTGQVRTQVEAIATGVLAKSEQQTGERPWNQEGWSNKEWILLDYADVVVHVFQPETRAFYALEDLWGDATIMQIPTS